MNIIDIEFNNRHGHLLSVGLELPIDRHPHTIAILAHCFQASGNLAAVYNISRPLIEVGIAVVRFDFIQGGKADSGGTSAGISDLEDIAEYLRTTYRAPSLLIGHSLAGAAALLAAAHIPSLKALACIATPATASGISPLLKESPEGEKKEKIGLGTLAFIPDPHLLLEIRKGATLQAAKDLNKALLLLHGPNDDRISFAESEALYREAGQPKSLVSLEDSSHLLENPLDSNYAGSLIATWAARYLDLPKSPETDIGEQVLAGLGSGDGFTTLLKAGTHYLTADEPKSAGGNDSGPSPYELVSAGLAACTAMTLQMYARRKHWPLEAVNVQVVYSKNHAEDCVNCEDEKARLDTFHRRLEIRGALTPSQRNRLLEIANKCPVHRTLQGDIRIPTEITD